jgi:hypothetical protein
MSELFAGCAKSLGNATLLTRLTVSRADLLSRMIWEARGKSPNGKLAGSRHPGDTFSSAFVAESR